LPKTRTEWWKEKINRNKQRDTEQKAALENLGWKVMTVWECEIKKNKEKCLKNILETIA
jgi:DNA mismatch endonuclease (patch repair protein)